MLIILSLKGRMLSSYHAVGTVYQLIVRGPPRGNSSSIQCSNEAPALKWLMEADLAPQSSGGSWGGPTGLHPAHVLTAGDCAAH